MKNNTINIPLNLQTIASFFTLFMAIGIFVSDIKVLTPQLQKVSKIECEMYKQSLALNIILRQMGLQDIYKQEIASAFPPDTTKPPTEIVEKESFCKTLK